VAMGVAGLCLAGSAKSEVPALSTYGTPGLVELPTAEVFDDGTLSFGIAYSGITLRNTATFQVFPRIQGSFRYSITDEFFMSDPLAGSGDLYDRSFDIQILVSKESDGFPAVAIGLRDFLGTGILSSEYVVATKTMTEGLAISGGLGWGRLAGRNSFDNPLSFLGLESEDRDTGFTGTGGQVEAARWFQGRAAFFGGVNWNVADNISVQLEYSPDIYLQETRFGGLAIKSPFNAALEFRYNDNLSGKLYLIGGENFGVQFNYALDSKARNIPGGREPAPASIVPRSSLAAASWNLDGPTTVNDMLRDRLMAEGLRLSSAEISVSAATVIVQNNRWDVEAQAAGRAARVMANTLPPEIEEFTIVFQKRGLPISAVTTARSDLEDLQYDYDATWRSLARAEIEDASSAVQDQPKLEYRFGPYTALSFFDPQSPIRADFGAQLDVSYQAVPGLTFDGRFRYPFAGNLGDTVRESDSVIERVRSESFLFAQESELEINRLTAEYLWRPAPDTFARVTTGYLENQYGGVSTEVLWSPIRSRFALGAEVNYARQREFDMLLGFQDYDVVTGHASAYYDLGNGFHTQVDLGRYLAGDWGGTLTVNREFNNGVKVGGYFTLTDVPFGDFGEGSFDKGLRIEIPFSFITGQPSRRVFGQTIQPILRDGGARLNVQNRLYPLVRDYRGPELSDGWGRYLR
jgi:hypothetical protein